ncbi:acetyl-CoA carboxylase, biotin carboxylase [Magnetococcus marinus MC-1]|uniref:Biotin carboxylase n=1 Tax=Magnetococcus marinus (strain ATCC BAA-1437 / JCM 17883 / MC-1) TaxID=156889 RepID=A0L5E4_MAGMM|nr:acetyl-CoA carboxylase biotin carboxylase subunit [Magnetococcus marinus]ABK43187.1 acetyl-CoA carboxylase, biotin carboxylase [Magnetococcus marinus MC-1]
MFKKVLIANRGEIALRVHRACKELGIQTVAIHSTADADSMHVKVADESVCVGPPSSMDSYLNISSIMAAAEVSDAEAIHPGYGFLSENPEFAEIVKASGLTFIGPEPEVIRLMGNKVQARKTMIAAGVPVVQGSEGAVNSEEDALRIAREIGFPVIIKAVGGGGGRGMKVVHAEAGLIRAYTVARNEARQFFRNDAIYIEKYLEAPRHVEIQIMCDRHGNAVHLGERDCSLQRRHQKILEEAPSPAVSPEERHRLGTLAAKAAHAVGYEGAGTFEFLYDKGNFYFLEMNTRIQVEHPVTEMVTGMDLVKEQIRIAANLPMSFTQEDIVMRGHSIECRINAEDSETFLPSPGLITEYHAPGGGGVRVDSNCYTGYRIPPHYDSMIGKLIVHGRNREEAVTRMRRALDEYIICGISTTIPLHQRIMQDATFISGTYDLHFLERFLGK